MLPSRVYRYVSIIFEQQVLWNLIPRDQHTRCTFHLQLSERLRSNDILQRNMSASLLTQLQQLSLLSVLRKVRIFLPDMLWEPSQLAGSWFHIFGGFLNELNILWSGWYDGFRCSMEESCGRSEHEWRECVWEYLGSLRQWCIKGVTLVSKIRYNEKEWKERMKWCSVYNGLIVCCDIVFEG